MSKRHRTYANPWSRPKLRYLRNRAVNRAFWKARTPAVERDRLWCQALIATLSVKDIAKVTTMFNKLRPD